LQQANFKVMLQVVTQPTPPLASNAQIAPYTIVAPEGLVLVQPVQSFALAVYPGGPFEIQAISVVGKLA
jgi:hypothetical protein